MNGKKLHGGYFMPKDSTLEEVERARLLAVDSRRKLEFRDKNIITREGSKYPVLGVEKTREGSKDSVFVVDFSREGSSILKPSRSGIEKTREGSKDPVFVVEKTREGSPILKLSRSGVEKTCEGSKFPVAPSKKRARCRQF